MLGARQIFSNIVNPSFIRLANHKPSPVNTRLWAWVGDPQNAIGGDPKTKVTIVRRLQQFPVRLLEHYYDRTGKPRWQNIGFAKSAS